MAQDNVLLTPLVDLINSVTRHLSALHTEKSNDANIQELKHRVKAAADAIRQNSSQAEGYHLCEVAILNAGEVTFKERLIVSAGATELQLRDSYLKTLEASGNVRCYITKTVSGL